MTLTKKQMEVLEFYGRHRSASPSILKMIRFFLRSWVLLAAFAAFSTWFVWAGWPNVTWFFVGLCFGAILRDVSRIIAHFQVWPLMQQIISWERADELLKSQDNQSA